MRHRRGGTCLQVNQLFSKLLRISGIASYCTGARLNAPAGAAADSSLDRTKVAYGQDPASDSDSTCV